MEAVARYTEEAKSNLQTLLGSLFSEFDTVEAALRNLEKGLDFILRPARSDVPGAVMAMLKETTEKSEIEKNLYELLSRITNLTSHAYEIINRLPV